MPGKVKVKIIAGRNLPVMDRSAETTDAYCEIKLGTITHKTDVIRKSLNPQWNSDWFRFEVDDADLQDEPLQIRLMDYDTYSANDAIGKVYINLNPLLLPHKELNSAHTSHTGKGSVMSGWIPVYDTMHGIRGEVNLIVKVDLFSDLNKFRQSSCGVQFFHSHNIPHGYHAQCIHGFVEELVVNDDPEYQWIDKIRTPRASNEARLVAFLKFSGQVQRKIGLKAIDLGGNAVIGYQQCFDLEGDVGVVARGIGTAVTLVKIHETLPPTIVDAALLEERTLKYLEFLTNEVAKSHYDTEQSGHNAVYSILGLNQLPDEAVAIGPAASTSTRRLNRLLNRSPVRAERTAVVTGHEKLDHLLHLEDSRAAKPAKKKFNLKLNKLKPAKFIAARRSSGAAPVRVAHKARSVDFSARGDIHLDKGGMLPRSVSDNQNIQPRRSVTDIRGFFGRKGKRQKFQRSSSDGASMANLLVRSMMVAQPLDSIHEHDSAGSSLKSTKGADAMHATVQRRPSVKSLIEELPDGGLKYAASSDFSLSTTGLESSSTSTTSDREDDDDGDEDVSEACSFAVTPDNGPVDPETVSMVVRNVLADVDFAQADYFEPTRRLQVDAGPSKSPSGDSLDIHTGSTHVLKSRKGFVSESELIDRDTTQSHTVEQILVKSGGDADAEMWIQPGSTRQDSVVESEPHRHEGLFHGLKEKIHHLQDHMHFHHGHGHKEVATPPIPEEVGKERRNSLLHEVKDALHHMHMPHLHISEKLHHMLPHGHRKEEAGASHGLFQTAMETMLLDKLNIMEAQTGLTPDEAVPTAENRRRSSLDSAIERQTSIRRGGSLDKDLHLMSRPHSQPLFVSDEGARRPQDPPSEWTSELKLSNEAGLAGAGATIALPASTSTNMSTANNTISPVISHNNSGASVATPKMPATPRGDGAKLSVSGGQPSPARLSGTPGSAVIPIGGSSYGLCRRSSDSDLSITPKGNSLNERTSAFVRPGGTMLKPPLNHENLDMLEYPFITMGKYPNGFILHLGATVAARSVKLLERVPNPDEPETRDSWWNEIRMEIRSHARALGCNVVLGYSELTSITDDVCVLSATGTAAVVNLQYSADISTGTTHLDVSGASSKSSGGGTATKDNMATSLDRQDFDQSKLLKDKELLTTIESDTELGTCAFNNKENNGNAINGPAVPTPSSNSINKPCSMCHIPYVQSAVPFRISMLKCAICKRGKVPDVLLATIEMPETLQVTGRGCLLQAHVCRPKRDLRSESNAKEISDGLPFLEYELHKLLICKLKVKGMNALFGLKTTVTVGEKMIALVATATAVFLTALQPPVIPKVVGGNSWTDNDKLMELQRSIHDTVDKNREIYQLKTFQEYDTNNGTASKQLFPSDTDDSDDELTELDLNMGNKDACVLEVDDIQDLEVISHLMEGCPPDGFHVVNTQAVPGLHDLEVVKNLQMFTQIWRAKLSLNHGSKNFSRHFQRLLQTIYFKLRTMMPCAICDLRFRLDFPEAEEIQLMVNGVALGLGEPGKLAKAKRKNIAHSVSKDAIKRVDEDMIFSLDEDQITEVAPPILTTTLQHSGSLKVRKKSPIRGRLGSGRLTRHLPTPHRERYGVDITPLSYVPGARIDKYLGNLNFFFIRESTSVRENGGICGFVHSFVTELLAVVRAHVTALGGNAMIAFYMTELMLVDNPHKNQGQCLISVGGDVVFVSYFNED